MDTNIVVVSGNLTRNPEVIDLQNKVKLLKLGIANNETYYNQTTKKYENIPSYLEVSFFGNSADYWVKRLKIGDKIVVTGKMKQRRWEKDGNKGSLVYIQASNIEEFNYLSKKNTSNNSNQGNHSYSEEDIPEEGYSAASYYNEKEGGFIG